MSKAPSVEIRQPHSAANERSLTQVVVWGDMTRDAQVMKLLRRGRLCLAEADRLIVDVRGVERADSRLVAAIILLYSQSRSAGVELELRVSRCVEAWLSVYRLDWLASFPKCD